MRALSLVVTPGSPGESNTISSSAAASANSPDRQYARASAVRAAASPGSSDAASNSLAAWLSRFLASSCAPAVDRAAPTQPVRDPAHNRTYARSDALSPSARTSQPGPSQ